MRDAGARRGLPDGEQDDRLAGGGGRFRDRREGPAVSEVLDVHRDCAGRRVVDHRLKAFGGVDVCLVSDGDEP